jgi:HK97 gp10 family phage protein
MIGRVSVVVVENRLPAYRADVERKLAAHVRATAERISTDAKQRAPVKTGNLRASITAQMTDRLSATVGTGPQAPYAEHVHEGTRRMSPRPFMRQASEAVRSYWEAGLRSIFGGR